ncbi:hypothetical protein K5_134 [Pseudomonas phage K5]|uniref:Uncharacterized protein n=2 Tax=Pakpunavirus TaxID=1921407 RepID=G0YVC0_9CAUD|nr:hypothetical protein PaP1_gp117 [Pseudomonas phage PaP1]YP_009200071.1 hypothetical protein K8_135 [Pseudomonas phage K8]YP_009273889.1 hypothetical protein BH773_gp094 [Pseudomonas phage K5]YP_010762674.1 hypothetical protein QE325_gp093 [Pseudomonas phage pPA-3099-2aT.2]YP_010763943.1 hypothetical protein QE333_gp051 [Pseudomonas phage vB_PaeM_B31]KEH08674.1 hypothetical protein GY14_17300 [Delftia tsuruhatensis]KEH13004.1 hypothetical protein GY15_16730 [Delftia sp. 670]WQZ01259.1 hypo
MNGAQKFHSPDGPAFNQGELWESCEGHVVEIKGTERYGSEKWDVNVYYVYAGKSPNMPAVLASRQELPAREFSKDAWNFQVRYQHQADKEI